MKIYRIRILLSALIWGSLVGRSLGDTTLATYTGASPDNHWFTAANWNPATVPGGDGSCIIIPPSSGRIDLNNHAGIEELSIGAGSELRILQSWGLFPADVIQNDGLITFDATGLPRVQTSFDGSMTFNGSGTVRMAKTDNNPVLWGQNGTNKLTNGPNHTLEGFGYFQESIESIENAGLINANVSGEMLQGIRSLRLLLNGGELRAESGGSLQVTNSDITGQDGGFLRVGDGSLIDLHNLTLSSTEIKTSDLDGDLSNNRLIVGASITTSDVTNAARIEVYDDSNNRFLRIKDSFTNHGEIVAVGGSTGSTGIVVEGSATLSGQGKVILNHEQQHFISGTNASDTLMHGAGHTIEGEGIVGGGFAAIENVFNAGVIHSNQGGEIRVEAGRADDIFVNEPSGVLRVSNSGMMTIPGFGSSGLKWTNRGTIDVGNDCTFDAALNPTLGNILPTELTMESGKLHVDGDFDSDSTQVSSGIISGSGVLRAGATTLAENVVVRPGDDSEGTPGIGVLTFGDSFPTGSGFDCIGISSLAAHSDVVQFGGSTLELDIESANSHDAIQFGETGREHAVHANGSVRLKLNLTGNPSGFSSGDCLVIASGIKFRGDFRFGSEGQFTRECGGSTALVHPEEHGGLTVANLREGDLLTTSDGRLTFTVFIEQEGRMVLTQPFGADEVPGEDYTFEVDGDSTVGTVVGTINAPGAITAPTFVLVGNTAFFEVDSATGAITVTQALVSAPTVSTFSVSVSDSQRAQVNPTSITILRNPTLTLAAAPTEGGTVTGAGTFDEGTEAPITATAQAGYRFAGWQGAGVANASSASTTVSMTEDRSLTASFIAVQNPTLTLVATPTGAGTVTGAGTFDEGAEVAISATASVGYRFASWQGEGVTDASAASTTVRMSQDRSLTASFVREHTLTEWPVSEGGNGHVYEIVIVSSGITWQNAKTAAEARGGYLATATSDAENRFIHSLADTNDAAWTRSGWVSGPWLGGFQPPNTTPADAGWEWVTGEHWEFTSWFLAGGEPNDFGGDERYIAYWHNQGNQSAAFNWNDSSDEATSNGYVVEYNQQPRSEKTLSLAVTPQQGGTVTGAGTFEEGSAAPITATVKAGYRFAGWQGAGVADASSASTTVSMTEDRSLTASFELIPQDNGALAADLLTGPGAPFEGESDPMVIGPEADPDGDGLSNVFEIWAGFNPATPNPHPRVTVGRMKQGNVAFGVVSLDVDPRIDDLLQVGASFSSDLKAFAPGIREGAQPAPGGMRRVTFRSTSPVSTRDFFNRLTFDQGITPAN